ncbi:MAG TPA: DUF2905 domain-containing protein [Bacteroidales bacterium]|nr:DUF2905 domain-containing protein [Bacteroidales bacterium]
MQHTGRILIIAGIVLIFTGIILLITGNKPGWLGHLPGDIRIERDNFRFYFPVTTLIIISLILNLIIWLIRKLH